MDIEWIDQSVELVSTKEELELGVKKTGFLVDKIKIGSIIKANASKSLRNQLFRVYNIKKSYKK